MKILLVNPSFKGGGITSYAHELINCFRKLSDFSVMIGDDSQNPITETGVAIYKVDSSDLSYKNVCKALELINNNISGYLVKENDINTVVEKILFLNNNPEECVKLGSFAKENAFANFSLETSHKTKKQIYEELLL